MVSGVLRNSGNPQNLSKIAGTADRIPLVVTSAICADFEGRRRLVMS